MQQIVNLEYSELMPKGKRQNFNKKNYRKLVGANVVIRIILGPLLFIIPTFSTLAIFILDWADGEFFKRAGFGKIRYEMIDKVFDLYWYMFIILFIVTNPVPNKTLFYGLFGLRIIGQSFYLSTKKEAFLFFFPNFFEVLFYVYIASLVHPPLIEFLYLPKIILTLLLIIPTVLIREYILHIRNLNLSWFFTGVTTYWKDEYN